MPPELYGPFGALAVLSFVVVALIRGDLVPGYIHKREITRGDRNDTVLAEAASLLRDIVRFLDMPPRDDGGR